MIKPSLKILCSISALAMLVPACTFAKGHESTPVAPTSTMTASASVTPAPLPIKLESDHFQESGDSPRYQISAKIPKLAGRDDPTAQAFNDLAKRTVMDAIAQFKESLKYAPVTPLANGSSFDVTYNLVSPPGNLVSIKFVILDQEDGVAYPYQLTRSMNFDAAQGKEIELDSLFEPNSSYLQVIADYCRAELGRRKIGFNPASKGADPTPENYRSWNLTADSLMINFDANQVAPYTAGLQTVMVPYANLRAILHLDGPIAQLLH
jgi:hypothetical protein